MQFTPQVIFVGKLFETISIGVPISALRSVSPHLYSDYNSAYYIVCCVYMV